MVEPLSAGLRGYRLHCRCSLGNRGLYGAPHITYGRRSAVIVAVFGTTISPYLFFWQAGEEVEDEEADPRAKPLTEAPAQAPRGNRPHGDRYLVGMGFSNIVALFIMLTTAATLNAHGITDIQTSAEAAEALRPLAGRFAFTIFALGIIGTGLLALPVLAGSAAYAVGEALDWRVGLAAPVVHAPSTQRSRSRPGWARR